MIKEFEKNPSEEDDGSKHDIDREREIIRRGLEGKFNSSEDLADSAEWALMSLEERLEDLRKTGKNLDITSPNEKSEYTILKKKDKNDYIKSGIIPKITRREEFKKLIENMEFRLNFLPPERKQLAEKLIAEAQLYITMYNPN
jgi:hypothetical protein